MFIFLVNYRKLNQQKWKLPFFFLFWILLIFTNKIINIHLYLFNINTNIIKNNNNNNNNNNGCT